ncbi:carbamoyltransferase C-terminal domain-containing protein [Streptomyces sp. FH025]|uniref:carbamoyltransferase family protein n=1 Tax=Streptomyces sp. FH025 TaxID=2815937 RepID=UPI001A9CE895|nr:carbamoyltransferase C-terminal domain-containing protein [Streptomyces sp. FH025]MBO1416990.1 carbamoyltransferase [Streptomyces sp. FH025]
MTLTLGLNFGTHDAAAAIVHNGTVAAAVEEERLNRIKNTKVFPERAIQACLDLVGARADDLDQVALFVDPKLHLLLAPSNLRHGTPASIGSLLSDLDKYRKRRRLPATIRSSGLLPKNLPLIPVPHHRAHAASAYHVSPFEDALVVTLDGRGEYETAVIFEGIDGQLIRRHHITYPHSFGYLYSALTRYLGFRPQSDEYKVMGLAAYGSDTYTERLAQLAKFDADTGRLRLDLRYFDHHRRPSRNRTLCSPALTELLGPSRNPGDEITDRHRDIAHALQSLHERLVGAYIAHAQRLMPRRTLCLAGGVALNCVANAAIINSGRFDQVFIQPAAGDAGTSIGAALIAGASKERLPLHNAFLGPAFGIDAIEKALSSLPAGRYEVRRTTDPHQEAARLLHAEQVIGWFQGRMEFGPRALGARSILASPRSPETAVRINAMIKQREAFRPFAPAVLAECADEYFDLSPAGALVYPYMLATAPVRPERRNEIPAVVHMDGSARVQTIGQETNPHLWRLVREFKRLSGLPVVLNTSFNGADEPIVCTPQDAVRTFSRCGLDALVIGPFVVRQRLKEAIELPCS